MLLRICFILNGQTKIFKSTGSLFFFLELERERRPSVSQKKSRIRKGETSLSFTEKKELAVGNYQYATTCNHSNCACKTESYFNKLPTNKAKLCIMDHGCSLPGPPLCNSFRSRFPSSHLQVLWKSRLSITFQRLTNATLSIIQQSRAETNKILESAT